MRIVTFYSFKGGVGRTLALANIACLLAEDREHPQRVLLWDFDLEAPGIHRLFPPSEPRRAGFVHCAYEIASGRPSPELDDYIYQSSVGGVFVLHAGSVDSDYADKLQQIDWAKLAAFGADGGLFETVKRSLEHSRHGPFDYVLIDSRTGLNDQSGICTHLLPDHLVCLFRLSDQNLDGIEFVVRTVCQHAQESGKRPPLLTPVVSPVGATSHPVVAEIRRRACRVFESDELEFIRFDPDLVSDERLSARPAVREKVWPTPSVITDYERLCHALRDANPSDTRTALRALRRGMESGDYASTGELLLQLLDRRPRLRELWRTLDRLLAMHRFSLDRAEAIVGRIGQHDPQNPHLLRWQAIRILPRVTVSEDAQLIQAITAFRAYVSAEPSDMEARLVLGKLLGCTDDLDEATRFLKETHSMVPANASVQLDLAMLLARRGRDFFSSAIDVLEGIARDIPQKLGLEAVLWASLGDGLKSQAYVTQFRNAMRDEERADLLAAYVLHLLRMNGAAGAEQPEPAAGGLSSSGLLNWSEYFVCCGNLDAARKYAEKAQRIHEDPRGRATAEALLAMTDYLAGSVDREVVVTKWQQVSWSFTEMLIVLANVHRSTIPLPPQFAERFAIVRTLAAQADVEAAKQTLVTASDGRVRVVSRRSRSRAGNAHGPRTDA